MNDIISAGSCVMAFIPNPASNMARGLLQIKNITGRNDSKTDRYNLGKPNYAKASC
ncbi:MAG: hypothetical protein JWQ14_2254 [Adhaeribacter sp.]|nr:hypothetical protein [Adhaeribacter sp.]